MLYDGGPGLYHAKSIVEKTKIVVHCVGTNVGSAEDVDVVYLSRLKKFCDEMNPLVVSDHLCFSKTKTHNSFDLLPLPYTQSTLNLLCEKVEKIQNFLGRQFSLENISSYISYQKNEYTEIEFLNELCRKTGCGILLDVNNIYVSGKNHGFNPLVELERVKPEYVQQYHISGHSLFEDEALNGDTFLFDTHDKLICDEVWNLMNFAIEKIGIRPAIIERDDDDCPIEDLLSEWMKGNKVLCKTNSQLLN